MTQPAETPFVFGHEVLSLVEARGGRMAEAELRAEAARVFGAGAVYGNCHGDRFGFDGLLAFLESAGKLARSGEVVSLGRVPGCSGH